MIELMMMYSETYALLAISAVVLPLIGMHLPPRQQSVQSLMLAQMAVFGVLLGMLIEHQFDLIDGKLWPLALGLIFTLAGGFFMRNESQKHGENFYLVFFIFYSASGLWLVSSFPGLESHHSQAFFGDVVTIYGIELWATFALMCLTLSIYLMNFKTFLRDSFDIEVLGAPQKNAFSVTLFRVLTLVVITASIYTLGMLFTLGLLFIGPTFLAPNARGLNSFVALLVLGSLLSVIGGFTLSLSFPSMSTVPTIVVVLVALFFSTSFWQSMRK